MLKKGVFDTRILRLNKVFAPNRPSRICVFYPGIDVLRGGEIEKTGIRT